MSQKKPLYGEEATRTNTKRKIIELLNY